MQGILTFGMKPQTHLADNVQGMILKWNGQRPVWDNPDEIDVALVGDALVTVFRYLPHEALPIFITCLEPERSEAVKISAVRACTTLISEVRN